MHIILAGGGFVERLVFFVSAMALLALTAPIGMQTIICDGLAAGGSGE